MTHNIPVHTLSFDAVLIGGGVAGLWLLNRLHDAGYNAILFEADTLGAGQSIASQGMIHGGIKYTLAGSLSGASEAIADMPDYWRRCLAGKGNVNLAATQMLSDHFYMWSTESTLSKITGFLASKALRGRVDVLEKNLYPPVFCHPDFKGTVYQLVDSVIDTESLLQNLAHNVAGRIFRIDWQSAHWIREKNIFSLDLQLPGSRVRIEAGQFIFSAGKGNEVLIKNINAIAPAMQLRPLQQVLVKHPSLPVLYGHCIGSDSTPRLTISSHPCPDGEICWYLGGQLAENGVQSSPEDLIRKAKTELAKLFTWLDWNKARWATYRIDRAEPRQKNLVRPDKAFIDRAQFAGSASSGHDIFANVLVAWPTKLTLAPHLGDECVAWMQKLSIAPGQHKSNPAHLPLPAPLVASPPWISTEWYR